MFYVRIYLLVFLSVISLGKFGSFPSSELIGQPFGHTYEIVDGGLRAILPFSLNDPGKAKAVLQYQTVEQ